METETTSALSAELEAEIREWLRYVVENDVNLMHFGPAGLTGRGWETEFAGLFAALDATRQELDAAQRDVRDLAAALGRLGMCAESVTWDGPMDPFTRLKLLEDLRSATDKAAVVLARIQREGRAAEPEAQQPDVAALIDGLEQRVEANPLGWLRLWISAPNIDKDGNLGPWLIQELDTHYDTSRGAYSGATLAEALQALDATREQTK